MFFHSIFYLSGKMIFLVFFLYKFIDLDSVLYVLEKNREDSFLASNIPKNILNIIDFLSKKTFSVCILLEKIFPFSLFWLTKRILIYNFFPRLTKIAILISIQIFKALTFQKIIIKKLISRYLSILFLMDKDSKKPNDQPIQGGKTRRFKIEMRCVTTGKLLFQNTTNNNAGADHEEEKVKKNIRIWKAAKLKKNKN